jgi:hypothetical protein
MDDELLTKAREAIEARLKAMQPQQPVQYNLVIPITEEHLERILSALEKD